MAMSIQIEYDPAKDRLNRHWVGLEVAAVIFATPSVQWTSLREGHGEVRYVAVGLIEGLEFTCVFTMRRQVARIISVRRSRHEERERFWKVRRAQIRAGEGDA